MARRTAKGGDEQDAFSPWRKVLHWQRGEIKRLKRKANKRDRKEAKQELRSDDG